MAITSSPTRWISSTTCIRRSAWILMLLSAISGCSIADFVNAKRLPADVLDPSAIKTPGGALAAYRSVLTAFANVLGGYREHEDSTVVLTTAASTVGNSYILLTGLLTDELVSLETRTKSVSVSTQFPSSDNASIDSRTTPTGADVLAEQGRAVYIQKLYANLHMIRARARQGIGMLQRYAPESPPDFRGHLFAIAGFAEVLLSELFCSGIPLSTFDFEENYTVRPGSSNDEVFQHALSLFDSAIVYTHDSLRIRNFIQIGRGRALLNLGDYESASQAVADIPTDYTYPLIYDAFRPNFFITNGLWAVSVGNRDGLTGLPFIQSGDPRTLSDSIPGTSSVLLSRWVPRKYLTGTPSRNTGVAPIIIASGVEARLIEAEDRLAREDASWLTALNALRTTCSLDAVCPTPAPMGSGGVTDLPPLEDPGSDSARISLLFRERANWLFLTGHRQGDLRRQVRQYNRDQSSVYPTGPWGLGFVPFGDDVNFAVPPTERRTNNLYHGCFNRDA